MKRAWIAILVFAVVVTAMSTSYVHAAMQAVGDVNGDGRVNNRDLGYLQQVLNGWDVATDVDGDVNGDGRVNNRDMGELQQLLNLDGNKPKAATVNKYVSLGAPAAQYYPSNRVAQCAWDMTIFDGRLYVGCGDFSRNPGDAPILSCPMNDVGKWTVEATIPDEQVGRFININGVLTIPGFDPVGAPTYGSFYELLDGEWQKQENLPDGLHAFDMVWFQGRMYAAIGAERGHSPIAYTEDGVTYETLSLYKNGKVVDTSHSEVIRSCNFYVLNNHLYADFWYEDETTSRSLFEMYHYNVNKDRFEYVSDIKSNTHGGLYSPGYLPLWEKAAVGNKMFFTTGYLYYTADFINYTNVAMPNDAIVYDIVNFENRLYILSAYESNGKYEVTVYSAAANSPSNLRTEASYTYSLMPTSFAVDANNFFVGMGNWYNLGSVGNGTILQIKR